MIVNGVTDRDAAAVREHDRLHDESRHDRCLRVSGGVELRLRAVDRAVEHERATVGPADRRVSAAACQNARPEYVPDVIAVSVDRRHRRRP